MFAVTNRSIWAKLIVIAVLAVTALTMTSAGTFAASSCKKISGKFTLQPVTGPACSSSVGICATGTYKGGIAGTSQFTGSSLIATADTPTTGVVFLTGDNVIETDNGTLFTKDALALHTTGAGEFAEVDTITGGTGGWAGTTGTIEAIGTFSTTDGGAGEYTGQICQP